MGTIIPQSNGPLYSNTVIGTLAVDGWAVTNIWYSDDGHGRDAASVPSTDFILFDVAVQLPLHSKGLIASNIRIHDVVGIGPTTG